MTSSLKERGNPGSDLFEVHSYPFFQLNRTTSRYNQMIEAELRTIDLEVPAWRVLMILGEQSPMPIGRIADLAVINISTMMRLVGRMKRLGLVASLASASDKRVTQLELTAEGKSKLQEARALTAPIYARAMKTLDDRDHAALLKLLEELHANLKT